VLSISHSAVISLRWWWDL